MSLLKDTVNEALQDISQKGNETLKKITEGNEIKTDNKVSVDNKTIISLFGLAAFVIAGVIIVKSVK